MSEIAVGILVLMLFLGNGQAQDTRFVQDMEAALAIHDTASSVASEILALDTFRSLCQKYDKEWLPHYWTAYLLTQVARLKGRAPDFPKNLNPSDLIDESQRRFDVASRNLPNKNDTQKSDFHMLQGFIYGWRATLTATNEKEKERYKEKRLAEYRLAVKLNPQNPMMYVMAGIGMLSQPRDYRDALISAAMLNYADEIFSREPKRSMTTYWNKDFIPYWRSVAEKKLTELLDKPGA